MQMLRHLVERGGVPRSVLAKAHDKDTADALAKVLKTMTWHDITSIA